MPVFVFSPAGATRATAQAAILAAVDYDAFRSVHIDILTRLGEAFAFDDLEHIRVPVDDTLT